ncbi:HBL/NHE enterotoxin family protein [Streptomyces roseoverticillatus]|uniref:HBL/NHE enterotoxin family protein n=1 Tax=Streptomyces roseoverticillatus TaxID=66429 RepID=UPI001F16C311|nr:HBL/NHE enterotoxin family protein [Streptomyces roseoverticillatus]MCF3106963.1 HBL/NHE enterotoxin family protein [Streptomyces roseoverticillatus]
MPHLIADENQGAFSAGDALNQQAKDAASARAVVEAYVTMVLEQPIVKLDKIEHVEQYQNAAKDHATTWRNSVSQKLIQTNTDLLAFANNFDSYYDDLVDIAENIHAEGKRAEFIEGVQDLLSEIEKRQKNAQDALDVLNAFRSDVDTDHGHFVDLAHDAHATYEGDKGEISQLKDEAKALGEGMTRDLTIIAGCTAAGVIGGLMIVVGALLEIPTAGGSTAIIAAGGLTVAGAVAGDVVGAVDYENKKRQLAETVKKIADLNAEIAVLDSVEDQFKKLKDANELAAQGLTAMANTWAVLQTKFKTVIDYSDGNVTPDKHFLKAKLKTAKADWEEVHKTADLIEQQMTSMPVQRDGLAKAA